MSSSTKWFISLWSVIIFIIVSNPFTYIFTNKLKNINPNLNTLDSQGRITVFGYILHMVIFLLIVRISMNIF